MSGCVVLPEKNHNTMHQVIIYDVSASSAIAMKNILIADGLTMDQDFTWAYQQEQWDDFSHDPVQRKCVMFRFVRGDLATYYQLKWG
jgi:hypothetical protein